MAEVFVGETPAVMAALSAGLAISPFPRRLAPAEVVDVGEVFGLRPLPSFSLVLHASLSDQRTKETLRAIAAAFREHRTSSENPIRLVQAPGKTAGTVKLPTPDQ